MAIYSPRRGVASVSCRTQVAPTIAFSTWTTLVDWPPGHREIQRPVGVISVLIDLKILTTVFAAVFIAELGDKTQLATLLFAADKEVSKLTVFVGASLALIATSALGVLAGGWLAEHVSPKLLHVVAGVAFIVIGIWTLVKS
jgi:putative Ca2+/H+ antiporter (TMEM165/GDT1 family)